MYALSSSFTQPATGCHIASVLLTFSKLNTLANHGFLPRNGQSITGHMLQQAFLDGFGVDFSVTNTPRANGFNVCQNVSGVPCKTISLNILQYPHMFEHDHSFSREDYQMAYSGHQAANNHDFNATIFSQSLSALHGKSHMNIQDANELRLGRESSALLLDYPGWFFESKPTQETEVGFIFAVMKDFNLPNYLTNPKVRVDWWSFWFGESRSHKNQVTRTAILINHAANQRFPTDLGWRKPTPTVSIGFVTSVSSAVLAAQVTSTPSPLPSGAIGPAPPATKQPPATKRDAAPTAELSALDPSPTVPETPAAATLEALGEEVQDLEERQLSNPLALPLPPIFGTITSAAAGLLARATAAAGTPPRLANPYAQELAPDQWGAQALSLEAYESKIQSALQTLI